MTGLKWSRDPDECCLAAVRIVTGVKIGVDRMSLSYLSATTSRIICLKLNESAARCGVDRDLSGFGFIYFFNRVPETLHGE